MQNIHTHAGDLGDIIYYLPFLRKLGGTLSLVADFHGQRAMLSNERVRFILPLLNHQTWSDVHHAYSLRPEPVSGDGEEFSSKVVRDFIKARLQGGNVTNLMDAAFLAYNQLPPDRFLPWLCAPRKQPPLIKGDYVVFARSERYHSADFPWRALVDRYVDRAVFVGTSREFDMFSAFFSHERQLMYWTPYTAVELENVLLNAKAVFCNQSLPYAICEGHKRRNVFLEQSDNPLFRDVCFNRPHIFHNFSYTPNDLLALAELVLK